MLISKSAAGLIAATLATSLGTFALADNIETTEAVVNHHLGAFGAGDVAYIVWNAETDDNIYQIGKDTFVVKDGKIMKQTFTTLTVSKK